MCTVHASVPLCRLAAAGFANNFLWCHRKRVCPNRNGINAVTEHAKNEMKKNPKPANSFTRPFAIRKYMFVENIVHGDELINFVGATLISVLRSIGAVHEN